MRIATMVLCGAFLAPVLVNAQSDVFLQAVGFALTGSDNAKVRQINRTNCVFGITGKNPEVFHLNNVHVDRIVVQSWTRRQPWGEEKYVTVELHGDKTVYEQTTKGIDENSGSPQVREMFKQWNPDFFKPQHTVSNEQTLTLMTGEADRVTRAWQYIYSNGCTGQKSPF